MGVNTGQLAETMKFVTGLAPIAPSTSTPDYVSMKGYQHLTVVIVADNATTVTGSAITLKQATAVAATGEKALAFTSMRANIDTAAADALTVTAVTSNTFTTTAVDNKNSLYVIEIDAEDLDVANSFDCVRVGTGDTTAQVLSATYILSNSRYGGETPLPSAITD